MMRKTRKTPSKRDVKSMADAGDRFVLMASMFTHVRAGSRLIADVQKVGPVNAQKCVMPIEQWDAAVKARASDGRCKGFFFHSFGRNHSFRRCEIATDKNLCGLCAKMREAANARSEDVISVQGQAEYAIVATAIHARDGVQQQLEYWTKATAEKLERVKVPNDFPFFTGKEVVEMLMVSGRVVFPNGGKGGTTYKRPLTIVQAQDEHLRVCMQYLLVIFQHEEKQHLVPVYREGQHQ